jgi:integrase
VRQSITTELIRRLTAQPPDKDVDIYDTHQPRLVLRARTTGRHTFRVALARGQWLSLGPVESLSSPTQARLLAQQRLGEFAGGADPRIMRKRRKEQTLSQYILSTYQPWLVAHRRSATETVLRLMAISEQLGSLKLSEVTSWHVERFRTARLNAGRTPATVNRDVGTLRAMLSRAVDWGHLTAHPMRSVRQLREDKIGRLRYLLPEEEVRLRSALQTRDDERRLERERANEWRRERGYDEWPLLGTYTDHLAPLVLLALNTGLRFGELTSLRWADVNLRLALITVRGEAAKSGKTRHVPLNAEAAAALKAWLCKPSDSPQFVFPGRVGAEQLVDIKTSWKPLLLKAGVTQFRFHDLRHTFASKLVMAGVDLNTVRELLGHADIKMTLRYAHLAPEHKAAAVERLVAMR